MLEKGYGASIIGKAHIKLKKPNQDSYLIANEDEYIIEDKEKVSSKGYRPYNCIIYSEQNPCTKTQVNKNNAFVILILYKTQLTIIAKK